MIKIGRGGLAVAVFSMAVMPLPVIAQARPLVQDSGASLPVLRRLWKLALDSSQLKPLAQALIDSIGPRVTGTPQADAALEWVRSRYVGWGIPARRYQFGRWVGWNRGVAHVDLVAPRVRTLEAMLRVWSPGMGGKIVEAEVVMPPADTAAIGSWLQTAKGKFILHRPPQRACRPKGDLQRWLTPGARAELEGDERALQERWRAWATWAGAKGEESLKAAGVAGLLHDGWTGAWGIVQDHITFPMSTWHQETFTPPPSMLKVQVPTLVLGCEDYGMLARLAEHRQGPRIRVTADGEMRGEVPVFNVLAELKGTEKPEEYVILNAHLDSWDAGTMALDNGVYNSVLLEVMRLLKSVYPKPKRSILVVHWTGEEQGAHFIKSLPKAIVDGSRVRFHFDYGTGRIKTMKTSIPNAERYCMRWVGQLPMEVAQEIQLACKGSGRAAGADSAGGRSASASGALAFAFDEVAWSYNELYHSNRDTFDKLVFSELKPNAGLIAMLVYLASEDPTLP